MQSTIEAHIVGSGKKLLLLHGLGGTWKSWLPILDTLAASREVIAIDLPGHGNSPSQINSENFEGLSNSLEKFIVEGGLKGVDIAGISLGGRLVLEMAKRGCVGDGVALDPGGFWEGWERGYFRWTLGGSFQLLQLLKEQLAMLSASPVMRTALLAQLSARPWTLTRSLVGRELSSFASTPNVGPLIKSLAKGPTQLGPASISSGRLTIGWGRKDRLCPPHQAKRACAAFPSATLHWFEESGHYSIWDCPKQAADLILRSTGSRSVS